MIAKAPVLVVALLSATLLPRPAIALSREIGNISCDVISGYASTSPAYDEVFQSYLEGYLAGEKNTSAPGRDVATLMSKVIEYCSVSRDASFASAVAAVVKQ